MISKLLSHIRTVDERDKLLAEVDVLLASIYELTPSNSQPEQSKRGNNLERTLSSSIRFWVTEIIKEEVTNDQDRIEKYLKDLKQQLEDMEIITLKLAFEPTDISIDKFFDYIKRGSNNDILKDSKDWPILNFEYDPRIIGGALISWKGEYRDFSLRRLFEEEYELKKAEIMKIMYSK